MAPARCVVKVTKAAMLLAGNRLMPDRTSDPLDSSASPDSLCDLSVVIAAFHESKVIADAVRQIDEYAGARGLPVELIIVDDGSADDTTEAASRCTTHHITLRLFTHVCNHGKGYAIRRGMEEARGRRVLMCDADMSTPIGEVERLEPWLDRGGDVAIGSRRMSDSQVDPAQGPVRRLADRCFRAFRGSLLLRDIRDTQCGFKLFTRDAAQRIFTRQSVDGFAFDCEVLALARMMGLRIAEQGVVWRNNPDSRVRLVRDGWRMVRDVLIIYHRTQSIIHDRMPQLDT
jgi:dolichyl-phosphate beta-glucosyltransferase